MTNAQQAHKPEKLKIALIVDSQMASKYVYELADWGQNQDNLEVTHLIIQNTPSKEQNTIHKAFLILKKSGFLYLAQLVGYTIIKKVESLLRIQRSILCKFQTYLIPTYLIHNLESMVVNPEKPAGRDLLIT
jgi:hypothetical protein